MTTVTKTTKTVVAEFSEEECREFVSFLKLVDQLGIPLVAAEFIQNVDAIINPLRAEVTHLICDFDKCHKCGCSVWHDQGATDGNR